MEEVKEEEIATDVNADDVEDEVEGDPDENEDVDQLAID